MFYLIIGFIVVFVGQYYLALKEVGFANKEEYVPKIYQILAFAWMIITFSYFAFVFKLILDGLILNEYMSYEHLGIGMMVGVLFSFIGMFLMFKRQEMLVQKYKNERKGSY